ncbi:type II toxin-antitoxin system RelE/ParE family toxin [Patescibacteria group bacterium]|nr:type II toxin-antitoxin system RelE/ParE family toxin [Patescibacteria group bacterium]
MKITVIHYNSRFEKQFLALSKIVQKKACKCEVLFRNNPFHKSLRLHKLKEKLVGLWSISIDKKNRIIFKCMDDGVIIFASIGAHAIYEETGC